MEMSSLFKDQFSKTSEWFSSWNECEQVVALYNLIQKMTPAQTCFLSKILPQFPSTSTSLDIDLLDYESNDPNYIANLRKETPDTIVKELIKLLPLLKECNLLAAKEYIKLISSVISSPLFKLTMVDDVHQLIMYLSHHPCISQEDSQQLYTLLNNLEIFAFYHKTIVANDLCNSSENCLPLVQVSDTSTCQPITKENCSGFLNEMSRESVVFNASAYPDSLNCYSSIFSQTPQVLKTSLRPSNSFSYLHDADFSFLTNGKQKLDVAKSLSVNPSETPKRHQALTRTASVSSSLLCAEWTSHQVPKGNFQKNQTFLTAEHAPLSPQSSGASTGSGGSESHVFPEDGDPAMIDVSQWLKSLRLHKYLFLFEKLTYNEMMNLTEDWLSRQGVTKGARNKILVHIKKLQERSEFLKTIETNVLSGQDLTQCINDLKPVVFAPISANDVQDGCSDGNQLLAVPQNFSFPSSDSISLDQSCQVESLPAQISRVLGKLCSQLLVATCPELECLLGYLQLLDRCTAHSAFSNEQKKRMTFWKQQVESTWNVILNKHSNKCKPSHLPSFNKAKSKLAPRYSNPIHIPTMASPQTGIHSRPILMHHVQKQFQQHLPPSLISKYPIFPSNCDELNFLHHIDTLSIFGQQQKFDPSPNLEEQLYESGSSAGTCNLSVQQTSDAFSLKMPLGRTRSAPLSSPAVYRPYVPTSDMVNDPTTSFTTEDIHANLESLCINMTEHALGSSND